MNNTDHHRCDPVEVGITGHQGGAFVIVFPRLVKEKPCAPRVPTIMASMQSEISDACSKAADERGEPLDEQH